MSKDPVYNIGVEVEIPEFAVEAEMWMQGKTYEPNSLLQHVELRRELRKRMLVAAQEYMKNIMQMYHHSPKKKDSK